MAQDWLLPPIKALQLSWSAASARSANRLLLLSKQFRRVLSLPPLFRTFSSRHTLARLSRPKVGSSPPQAPRVLLPAKKAPRLLAYPLLNRKRR